MPLNKALAALETLEHLGYTYEGGELWKPPNGEVPDFDKIDALQDKLNDAMESFWFMLQELEDQADNEECLVLKHFVEGWYRQYNRLTERDVGPPLWIKRKENKGAMYV